MMEINATKGYMVNFMKSVKKFFLFVLLLLVCASNIGISVYADGEKIGGSDGAQAFYHDATGYGGIELFYQDPQMTKPAYCLNFSNAYPSGQTFTKYDSGKINAIDFKDYWGYLSGTAGGSSNTANVQADAATKIPLILYLGYPNDAANLGTAIGNNKKFQAMTQAAIWHYTDSKSEKVDGGNAIIDYINQHPDLTVPDSLTAQIWTWDQNMSNRYQNMLIIDGTTPKIVDGPTIKNTTVTATAGSKSSSSTLNPEKEAELELADGESATIKDTIYLEELDGTKTYTVQSILYHVNGTTSSVKETINTIINSSEIQDKKVTKEVPFSTSITEEGEYKIVTTLYEGNSTDEANKKDTHNGDFKRASEVLKITKKTPSTGPTITNTTVTGKVEGTTKTSTASTTTQAEISIDEGEEVTLTDLVKYAGLDSTKQYKIVSTVYLKPGNTVVTGMTGEKTISGSEQGEFEYTISGKLSDEGTYTIVTTITEEGASQPIFTHNDRYNLSEETIKVTNNTPAVTEIINTTVTATSGTKSATAEGAKAIIEITEGEKAKLKDKVEFTNAEVGYTVVCTIYNSDRVIVGEAEEQVLTQNDIDRGYIEVEIKSELSKAGEYTILTNLKDGDGNIVAKHNEGFNEATETVEITVKEKPTPSSTPSNKKPNVDPTKTVTVPNTKDPIELDKWIGLNMMIVIVGGLHIVYKKLIRV